MTGCDKVKEMGYDMVLVVLDSSFFDIETGHIVGVIDSVEAYKFDVYSRSGVCIRKNKEWDFVKHVKKSEFLSTINQTWGSNLVFGMVDTEVVELI